MNLKAIRNVHRHSAAALLLVHAYALAAHAEPQPLEWPIWPAGYTAALEKPETTNTAHEAKDMLRHSIFNVSTPTLSLYLPPAVTSPCPAIVICPGGAYGGLAIDVEGHWVAQAVTNWGVAAAVLKYRVPTQRDDPRHRLPLQDLQRALSLLRSRASELNMDPNRLGVMGFSAGGHLAAHASCSFTNRAYAKLDGSDELSCRPDFAVLIYPAYLAKNGSTCELYPGVEPSSNTPPTFLVHAQDDSISSDNSISYSLALKRAKVPAYLVLFPKGGHGYGLGQTRGIVGTWPEQCRGWLRDSKTLLP